ncbi:MAG: hypothetical protein NZ879_00930 [Archaeoglobaceae archaeon]|nr:hypothetical protein [Archaeoglobaceae archaeon]MDW8117530.1 hypothetical protein [Archaeoglobaceae archaeon]
MPIAPASEFVARGILQPIQDSFILTHGMLEPIIGTLPPTHPDFVYGLLAIQVWVVKFLAAIMSVTASNQTLVLAFNDTLRELSVNHTNFFGNFTANTGMAYIANQSNINFTTNKPLAFNITVDFFRALKNVVIYISKAFEML